MRLFLGSADCSCGYTSLCTAWTAFLSRSVSQWCAPTASLLQSPSDLGPPFHIYIVIINTIITVYSADISQMHYSSQENPEPESQCAAMSSCRSKKQHFDYFNAIHFPENHSQTVLVLTVKCLHWYSSYLLSACSKPAFTLNRLVNVSSSLGISGIWFRHCVWQFYILICSMTNEQGIHYNQ